MVVKSTLYEVSTRHVFSLVQYVDCNVSIIVPLRYIISQHSFVMATQTSYAVRQPFWSSSY